MAKDLTDNFVANTYKGLLHAQGDEIPAVGEVDIYDGAGNKTDLTLGRETTICTSLSAGVLSAAGLEYPTEIGSKYDVVAQATDGENNVGKLTLQDINSLLCAGINSLSSYEPPTNPTKVPIPTIECGIVTGITEKNICEINEAIGGITSEYDPASYTENNFVTDLDVECGVVKKIHYGSISLPQNFALSSNKSKVLRKNGVRGVAASVQIAVGRNWEFMPENYVNGFGIRGQLSGKSAITIPTTRPGYQYDYYYVFKTEKEKVNIPSTGTYTIKTFIDDYGFVSLDGVRTNLGVAGKDGTSFKTWTQYLDVGEYILEGAFANRGWTKRPGNAGTIGVVITDSVGTVIWSTDDYITSDDNLIYSDGSGTASSTTTRSSTRPEDSEFRITLKTQNVPNGTLVPYTITGVQSNDINGAPLKGRFTVQDSRSFIDYIATNPRDPNETFTLTLDNDFDSASVLLETGLTTSANRFCITAINETEGGSFSKPFQIRNDYDTFRSEYPDRLLIILMYKSQSISQNLIYIAPKMVTDPNTIIYGSSKPGKSGYIEGDLALPGKGLVKNNWFNLAGLGSLASGDRIYYWTDPSGSMSDSKIRSDLNNFRQGCQDSNIEAIRLTSNTENYIAPFLRELP